MKKLYSLGLGLVLSLAATATAQTTNTVAPPTTGSLLGDLGAVGSDVYNDVLNLQPFTTNSTAMLQVGGGINTADKGWNRALCAVALTVPLSSTNDVFNFSTAVGCFGAYSGGGIWEDGSVSFQISQDATWPLIGSVHEFIEDGPSHNWKTGAYGNFAATGAEKTWVLSPNVQFGVGALVANDSTRTGADIIVGFHLLVHF